MHCARGNLVEWLAGPSTGVSRCGRGPMSEPAPGGAPLPRRPWLLALPLLAFLALAVIFWFRLGNGDPSRIPSVLIGRPAPQIALRPLQGLVKDGAQVPGLDPA